MVKTIKLSQGKFAKVDDIDFEKINCYKWHVSVKDNTCYAVRALEINGKKHKQRMHRFILDAPKDLLVDHINGDGLDNRRCNLRLCTSRQNAMNMTKRKNCSSQYKGVSWSKSTEKWQSSIRIDGKLKYLGCFSNEEDAAIAYNEAAKKNFFEFSQINKL